MTKFLGHQVWRTSSKIRRARIQIKFTIHFVSQRVYLQVFGELQGNLCYSQTQKTVNTSNSLLCYDQSHWKLGHASKPQTNYSCCLQFSYLTAHNNIPEKIPVFLVFLSLTISSQCKCIHLLQEFLPYIFPVIKIKNDCTKVKTR